MRTDDDQHLVTLFECVIDDGHEILSGLDLENIDEHTLSTQVPSKAVVDPACVSSRVFTPVADEERFGELQYSPIVIDQTRTTAPNARALLAATSRDNAIIENLHSA